LTVKNAVKGWVVKKVRLIRLLKEVKKSHLPHIRRIEKVWKNFKTRPKKLKVPRFKALFEAYLIGWRT